LDDIEFVWNVLESGWEEAFYALMIFKAREGHCRVPAPHIEGTFKLGRWVRNQRASKDKLPADRRKRLDEIDFIWRVET
jgi:hypothetical protein